MKSFKPLFYILTLLFLFVSCSDEYYENRVEEKLIKHDWRLHMYVDGVENQVVDLDKTIYIFKEDGTFIQKRSENQEVESTWELLDQEYIRVASSVFKIKTLTNRILTLKYGEDVLYFLPGG